MSQPRAFALTDEILARHARGVDLCLAPSARGQSFAMLAERPRGSAPWALQGRRADSRVWAPLRAFQAAAKRPEGTDPDEDPDSDDEALPGVPSSAPGSPYSEHGTVQEQSVVRVVEIRGLLASEVQQQICGWQDGYSGEGGIVDRVQDSLAARPAALVVDIDSPGGMAKGCGEAAAQLARMVADAQQSGIPVCVYARQAASAAYYLASALASAGASLFVSESSDVGCIGTFRTHVDASAANEKDGIKVTYIEDPEGKTAGNPDAPPSDEALSRMQRDVSEATDRFVTAVAAYRPGVPDARTLRGDVRRGQAAVDDGLADATCGGLPDVVAAAYARALLARPMTVTTSPGAMPAPSPMGNTSMQLPPEILGALGLDAKASDAALLASLAPRLALASAVMSALNEADPVRAKGVIGARLQRAAQADDFEAQLKEKRSEGDAVKRERIWEAMVADGRVKLVQAFTREEIPGQLDANGKPAVRRVYSKWSDAQNAAYPELAAFEGWADSLPRGAHQNEIAEPTTTLADLAEQKLGAPPGLSSRDQERARRAGLDGPWLAVLAQVSRRSQGGTTDPAAREGV